MDKHRLSLILVGFLAVVILFGGWFVGVQPQLDRIARADAQTVQIAQVNDVQQAKNDALAADNVNLDRYKGELAAAQAQIPAARAQQELINQLDAAATSAGVTVRTLSFDGPISFAAPEGVTVDAPSGGSFVAIPLTLTADGDRGALEQFVANVQSSPRIITISSSQYSGGDEGDSLTLAGATWVLLPAGS